MKKIFFILILALPLIVSCNEIEDCVCTQEFRMITVVVIDESNEPVTELSTTIKDDSGRIYDIQSDPGIFPGVYTVMDDSYVMELTTEPKRFIFTGVKESLSTQGEFFVVTDECNCHVEKFAGPDTLVLR